VGVVGVYFSGWGWVCGKLFFWWWYNDPSVFLYPFYIWSKGRCKRKICQFVNLLTDY